MSTSQLMRCEVARMFGGWPHDLLRLPMSEYKTLVNYYLAVREDERKATSGEESLD